MSAMSSFLQICFLGIEDILEASTKSLDSFVNLHNAEEHPIECASRLLATSERYYTCTEREALAIAFACNGLRWLMNIKSPTGRLARWALLIQSFNVKIDYLPGRRNVVADTLSKPQFPDLSPGEEISICMVCITIPGRSQSEVRSQQLEDPELTKIIYNFENSDDSELCKWTERGYFMKKLPSIRFAMNTVVGESEGYAAGYLTFARELRTPNDIAHDFRAIVESETLVLQITPYLREVSATLQIA
ncbi:hypothetical protein ILUMI_11490 [Ignelater luminosus]|uniref:Reverse transcriptase RNase H-like domain-containing protein n=1 Tax=Ignelater luminosus TaxID=2038154 RepID=A0A8K0CW46_IGNLU|nr:hypothetical protein ILUMI_11490 [Ignelater luminosus]